MYSRLSLIGAVTLTIAATAIAEPAKTDIRAGAKPATRTPELVLASAEQALPAPAATPDQTQATVAQPKKRAARVTSCRCGDQANSGQ